MKERAVLLNETGEWLLFRAMVCEAIEKNPNVREFIDCDPWEFSSALDMSFEEIRQKPLETWQEHIVNDMREMMEMGK